MREVQMEATRLGHRLLRNNVGKYQDREGRWVAYGVGGNGGSDLIGWTRDGRFAAVEVKTPTGRVTAEQQAFIDAVNRAGGKAGVARSVEDVKRLLG
jgi:hypothetical protein